MNIGHRCKFETEGCEVKMPLADIEEHKNRCDFRPVDCPSHLCDEKVAYQKVTDHILNQCMQAFNIANVENTTLKQVFHMGINKISSSRFKVKPIKWAGHLFFLNMKVENDHFRQLYVQMLGSKEECEKYSVEIKLQDKRGKHAIIFCDQPLPIEVPVDQLREGGIRVSSSFMRNNICSPSVDPNKVQFNVDLTFDCVPYLELRARPVKKDTL